MMTNLKGKALRRISSLEPGTRKDHFLDGKEYRSFLLDLKNQITLARVHAARSINRNLIHLYWEIGRGIVEKQTTRGWGQSVVEALSKDLQREFPGLRGFSTANLWAMRRFYVEYTDDRFLQQLVEELPWGHHLLLLEKVKDSSARLYYMRASARFGWSRNVLLNQIMAEAYERSKVKEKGPNDNSSIGIILCAKKDDLDVEFSLKSKTNPIGVASYRLTSKLPKEFRGKLPTERQLLSIVRESKTGTEREKSQ